MHRLLKKQIDAAKGRDGSFDAAMLLSRISAAYDETDKDRQRTDRSITLMVDELDRLNCGLEDLVARRTSELECVSQRLEAALSNVEQGIVMIDGEGRVEVANRKFAELTGLLPADYEGQPVYADLVKKMLDLGEFDKMGDDFKQWALGHGGNPGSRVFQRIRPDGTVLHVEVTSLSNGGEVRTMSDITSHVRHAEEISAIRHTLELTLENVSQGIIKFDADRRVSVFNRRAAELLGLPEGILERGKTMAELTDYQINNGEFANMNEEFNAFVRGGGVSANVQVYERQRPNGVILEIRTIPLPDGAAVRTYTDVTEIRQRQLALERAQEEYSSLFVNSVVGIYRSTIDGRQLRANPALVRLNGYDSEEDMIAQVNDIGQQWYVDPDRRRDRSDARGARRAVRPPPTRGRRPHPGRQGAR